MLKLGQAFTKTWGLGAQYMKRKRKKREFNGTLCLESHREYRLLHGRGERRYG